MRYTDTDMLSTQANNFNTLNALNCVGHTADVDERKPGKWVSIDEGHWMCSVCNEEWNIFENDVYRFLFCPNCGSKMDGKETEDASGT